nr:hypothetical protein [uncultured Mediterraneibacter sp.]
MWFKVILIIFDCIGAIFNFWQYRDTGNKEFLIPFVMFLFALICAVVSIIV